MMASILILAQAQLKKIEVPEYGKVVHEGIACSVCKKKQIVGRRFIAGNSNGDFNLCSKCHGTYSKQNPNVTFLTMKEPLPSGPNSIWSPTKASKKNKTTALLPEFQFEGKTDGKIIHKGASCESCGKNDPEGNLYKCANCEDFCLCETCYNKPDMSHHSLHVFILLTKPLLASSKT